MTIHLNTAAVASRLQKKRSLLTKLLLIAALSMTLGVCGLAAPSQVWVASSMSNIFQDTVASGSASTAISWVAARNEAESAQVCVSNAAAFTVNFINFTDLAKGSDQIPASALSYHFVEFITYSTNSVNLSYPVRTGSADYPDPLSNETSMAVAANTTQPVWVTVKVPKGQASGIYTGNATMDTTAGPVVVPISLEVVGVEIPDASQGFFNAPEWDLGYSTSGVTTLYGYQQYSPEWWDIYGKICDNAIANRTNVAYIVQMELMLDGGSYKVDATHWVFNWSRFDEQMQFLISKGFRRIYSEGLAWSNDVSSDSYAVYVDVIGGDQANPTWGQALVSATSNKMKNYLNAYLPALRDHLKEKGWQDIFATQILDEPRDSQNGAWDIVASYVPPEVRLMETFFRVSGTTSTVFQSHAGMLDTWIPSIQLYEDTVANPFLDGRQTVGDEKWYYTYGDNTYSYLNRLIDCPVYENRLLFWYAFANNMDGYLQWGYNWAWSGDQSADQRVHGDGRIIYPDVAHNTIKSSIRESNQRDGVEEMELFRILNAHNPATAQSIVGSVITSGAVYSRSIATITAARESLLRAVAAELTVTINSPLSVWASTLSPFNYNITATNSPTSFDAIGLPTGLSLDSASGAITGTPTVTGTFSIALNAIAATGTGSATLTLVVQPFLLTPPVITSSLNASGTSGSAFSYSITTTNNPTSFSASGLPSGLSIDTATGVISGRFTSAGSYSCTISAINSSGADTKTLILAVAGAPQGRFAYEGFDYAVTSNLSTAPDSPSDIGFTGTNWNTGANKVISPGLSYPGISSTGNAVQFTSSVLSSRSFDMAVAPAGYTQVDTDSVTRIGKPGCTLWIRFLIRADVADTSGTLTAGLNLAGAASGGNTKLLIGITGTNGNAAYAGYWNVFKSGTIAATSNVPVVTGSTVMLVTRVYYGVGTNKDEVDLYVNPPAGLTPPATPGASLRNLAIGTIDRVQFQGRLQSTGDELSIGTDWASAVMPLVPAPVITGTLAATGTSGSAFSYQITASNSPTGYSATNLPSALNIDPVTGLISGTPTTTGTFSSTISSSNLGGSGSSTLIFSIISPYTAWFQAQGFTPADMSNPSISSGTAAPARDGVPNLMKYFFNINPTRTMTAPERAALPVVSSDTTTTPGTRYLTLTYRQNLAAAGVPVNVQTSTDLSTWQTVTPDISGQVGTDPGTGDPIRHIGVKTNGVPKLFIRLNVSTP